MKYIIGIIKDSDFCGHSTGVGNYKEGNKQHDALDRLTAVCQGTDTLMNIKYGSNGNITFKTGAFIMMYNELQHPKSDIMLRQRLKRKIEKDGKLTFSEAMKWYKKGNGETIEVNVNSLNLDFLITEVQGKPIGYVFCFSTIRGGIGQFLVYGSLTAKYYGDNMIRLYNDTYNFEPHSTSDEHLRNIETEIGNFVHGQGTPFQIHFNGTYTIKNAFEQFSNRLSKSPL